MNKGLTIAAVVAILGAAFIVGRVSNSAQPMQAVNVKNVGDYYDRFLEPGTNLQDCTNGQFWGECTDCTECGINEFNAGGCTYFKDTSCLTCTAIPNCLNENLRCTTKDDSICVSCDAGYWGDQCDLCTMCKNTEWEQDFCVQEQDTVCVGCSTCAAGEFTSKTCKYDQDTECTTCSQCAGDEFIKTPCQDITETGYDANLIMAVKTKTDDTVCQTCKDCTGNKYVTMACTPTDDTVCTFCSSCPLGQYSTDTCDAGDKLGYLGLGEDTSCTDCSAKSADEWEVFKCQGDMDGLYKQCSECQDGEFLWQECTDVSDTVCPACKITQPSLDHCEDGSLRCSNPSDTYCDDCQDNFFGLGCDYHLHKTECGIVTTRARIARRNGFEGSTNEEFVQYCLELCDEFPDCMAFEIFDEGVDAQTTGPASYITNTAECRFKSSLTQKVDNSFKGTDPAYDCYSNMGRQNALINGAYKVPPPPTPPVVV